jgi:hypothetical protein
MDKFRGDAWLAYADETPPPPAPPAPEPEPDLPAPPPADDVENVNPAAWYIKKGDSPWSVAENVYGSGSKHGQLDASKFNSHSTSSKAVFVDTPGVAGNRTTVQDGEGVASIIRRLTGTSAWPSTKMFDTFADWNGGAGREFHPGDIVNMPG